MVRRKIAEGGMAEIFLCTSRGPEGFEKEVVIKRVHSHHASDPEFVQMFINEARLASKLNHANVVQIFDFDKHQDTYYLAMEYVRGQSLWDVRRRCRQQLLPMQPAMVAHVGAEIARGLHYAHLLKEGGRTLGLVHRDVSPHNILLSYDGAVKLTDFGIAKAGTRHTAPGMLKGKFAYMSPEQARGEEVDARTDVFALGIVLWEMLTGGRLFDAESDLATLRAVQNAQVAPPERINPDVPKELSDAVMHALDRRLSGRVQSAQELERALKQFVLRNASQVEDTDVGGFLRRLYPEEATAVRPSPEIEATESASEPEPGPKPRETAVLRFEGGGETGASLPQVREPEGYAYGPTWVLDRPSPPVPPPLPVPTPAPTRSPPNKWMLAALAGLVLVGTTAVVRKKAEMPPESHRAPLTEASAMTRAAMEGSSHEWCDPPSGKDWPLAQCGPYGACLVGMQAIGSSQETQETAAPAGSTMSPSTIPSAHRGAKGTLRLSVTPWARVTVDGRDIGEVASPRQIKLEVGDHFLRLVHPRGVVERKVTVPAKDPIQLSVNILE